MVARLQFSHFRGHLEHLGGDLCAVKDQKKRGGNKGSSKKSRFPHRYLQPLQKLHSCRARFRPQRSSALARQASTAASTYKSISGHCHSESRRITAEGGHTRHQTAARKKVLPGQGFCLNSPLTHTLTRTTHSRTAQDRQGSVLDALVGGNVSAEGAADTKSAAMIPRF